MVTKNTLYYGDNLEILREYIPDEAVDLIYLDPPFNSKQAYNIIFEDKNGKYPPSQIEAFDDTWHWGDENEEILVELTKPQYPPELVQMLHASRSFLGPSDMMSYLVMMAIRLWELRRVLKKTGSIYVHCDPTASHFLKLIMDEVFDVRNFRNEIIWRYRKWPTGKFQFQRNHDTVFFYTKSPENVHTLNQLYMDRAASTLKRFGKAKIVSGHDKNGKRVPSKVAAQESVGVRMDDVWEIGRVPPIKQLFPTQKPLKLLERIITASSNEGDVVLDPFCGCGTTVIAAEKLSRKWIGIDITVVAVNLIEKRLRENFPDVEYKVVGVPTDVPSARRLAADDKFDFEKWFVTALGGQPYKSSGGGDTGIDGFLYTYDVERGTHRIIISVKGGNYGPAAIRDLKGVVEREGAVAGLLLALNQPSRQSETEAAGAGRFQLPGVERTHPKIQVFTVEDHFAGKRPDLPDTSGTLKKAARVKREREKDQELPLGE